MDGYSGNEVIKRTDKKTSDKKLEIISVLTFNCIWILTTETVLVYNVYVLVNITTI